MNIPELLAKHEGQLKLIIEKLEANALVDLSPLAAEWKVFLELLKDHKLSEDEQITFDRIHEAFKKIEDILSDKMSELVMAKTMTQG